MDFKQHIWSNLAPQNCSCWYWVQKKKYLFFYKACNINLANNVCWQRGRRRMGIIVIGIKQREDMNLWRHDVIFKGLYPKALGAAHQFALEQINIYIGKLCTGAARNLFVQNEKGIMPAWWPSITAESVIFPNGLRSFEVDWLELDLPQITILQIPLLSSLVKIIQNLVIDAPSIFLQYKEDLWIFKLETNSYWQLISYRLFDVGISEHISMARGLVHV